MQEKDELPDEAIATAGHVGFARRAPALSVFDARWLWGIVVIVPILVSAGVFWLHHLPAGPQARSGGPIVEVRLVQETAPAPVVVALRADQQQSEGRPEPMIEAPNRPIPEETATVASTPATVAPGPDAERSAVTPESRAHAIPSGAASAFQRKLLGHIARFRRYPAAAPGAPHGIAHVMFAMRRDGTVSEVWVRRSSGHLVLDEAAAETIRRAQPLPNIPADLPDQLTILLPVSFDTP